MNNKTNYWCWLSYDVKNYADLGCYPPRLMAEVDDILLDLHNSSRQTKAEFNNKNIVYDYTLFNNSLE